ncbi:lysophospholipid acyltransferase family protein [Kiritimatiellaeota bacterium B1221]|nr:lysophospholipid acyltransferase family protein [Kiritimatiellaeota bacterium B1221]
MLTLLRTLFFFVVFWIHQLLILPLLVYFHVRHHFSGPEAVRKPVCAIGRGWGGLMCWLGGVKLDRQDHSGILPGEAVLFVSNHQGDFDIPILLNQGGRDLAFVAKKELGKLPLVSNWMYLMGCIFLDRDDRRKQVGQIKQTVANLQSGLSMVIFPEGTRSRGPEMQPFSKGSLNIAERAGVRIVPVTLKDSYTLKPKGRWGFPGGKAKMILHPAIDPKKLDPDIKARLHEHVQEIIQAGLDG